MRTITDTSLIRALETLGINTDHLYTAVYVKRKWHVRDWGFGHPGSGGGITQREDSYYSTIKGFGWPASCYTYANETLRDPPPWTAKQVADEIRDVIKYRKAAHASRERAWCRSARESSPSRSGLSYRSAIAASQTASMPS